MQTLRRGQIWRRPGRFGAFDFYISNIIQGADGIEAVCLPVEMKAGRAVSFDHASPVVIRRLDDLSLVDEFEGRFGSSNVEVPPAAAAPGGSFPLLPVAGGLSLMALGYVLWSAIALGVVIVAGAILVWSWRIVGPLIGL